MMGETIGLEKASKSGAAIATAFLLVKFGADKDHVVVATAVADAIIGIAQHTTAAAEETVRVALDGISRCKLGGTVAAGDPITATTGGEAVAAAPAAGVNNRIIGFALSDGVADDIIPVHIVPGRIQG